MNEVLPQTIDQQAPQPSSFRIWTTIKEGMSITWQNFGSVLLVQIVLCLLFFVLAVAINLPSLWFQGQGGSVLSDLIANLGSAVIELLGGYAGIVFGLQLADEKAIGIKSFFKKWNMKHFAFYTIASILCAVLIILGLIVFIIPGIYFCLRLALYGYAVVDQSANPVQSLKVSWSLVKGSVWRMLGFLLAIALVNILGLLCLFIGLFFTIPATYIATALVYRKLASQKLR